LVTLYKLINWPFDRLRNEVNKNPFDRFSRYEEEGDLSTKPKTGRHRVTTQAEDGRITDASIADPKMSSLEIQRTLGMTGAISAVQK